jgi:parvulin-like peptidyl-prolyl isomerase
LKIIYSQGEVTPEEVVKHLSLSGQFNSILASIIKNKEIIKKAEELNLGYSIEELQQFADNLRISLGLYSAEDTKNFLTYYGLTVVDFEQFCKLALLSTALRESLANENKIREYFVNKRSEFDFARISWIIVNDENLGHEIKIQIEEGEQEFHELARRHSVDPSTKDNGGYVGIVTRQLLPPEIAAKVFGATAGEVLGPFQEGKVYRLVLVEEIRRAEMDENVKESIKTMIFEDWGYQFLKDGIRVSLS